MRWPSFLLLLLLLVSCKASKRQQHRHKLHLPGWAKSEESEDSSNHLLPKQDTEHHQSSSCHRAAVHKCGQTFLRAHKLLSYLDDDLVAFRTRCGVRTAFFECLKSTREKICSRQSIHSSVRLESDFRKRLTDTLWSTRVCVLGVKSFR